MSQLAVFADTNVTDFQPWEDDSVRVTEGDPDVRMHTLRESEEIWAGIALVQPSKFEYSSQHAGAIQLLEGAATVTTEGRTVELKAGEAIFLEKGAETTWEVTAALREYFVAFVAED